ncbi:inhibitor of nuclear factor kappa-B kinase-interacting protein-like isoform X2 [Pristis pectinata]|uniref:inhibitor of nuclear factor kappa-B kinase-interacting protein-like isoform X2 n=1 Tax=Pristis pectinata TaxID=685728 RepID=UPI00223CA4B7|nr:inhibitor of nuclear factor kappa-B kinase-interacting protein-like isoform X2 [Pristis pectinata]
MLSELKQRRKAAAGNKQGDSVREQNVKGKTSEEPGKKAKPEPETQAGPGGEGSRRKDLRSALCLLSLFASAALAGVIFQQSANFADLEQKYQQLYTKSLAAQALEDKVSKVSKKLELSEEVLQKALSSSSVMTFFEQEMSELRSSMNSLQNKEQTIARKMQKVNENFQNISDTWKRSLSEINSEIANLKSESKTMHNKIKLEINTVEQGMKELSVKVEELEVSTLGNTRAIKRQEEEDLGGLEKQANWNTKSIEGLAEQQSNLMSKDIELVEKLTEFEPKFKECQEALPIIDDGVHSVLKVSRDLLTTEKKMDDMTVQLFNLEDNMLKVITEILDIKKELEVLQSDSAL